MTSGDRDVLGQRVRAVPALLRQLAQRSVEVSSEAREVMSWDVVGIGASEGPARLAIRALWDVGRPARLVPVSSFLSPLPDGAERRGLLIFSQGLSPNAQLALAQAGRYRASILVTAVTQAARPERAEMVASFPGAVYFHPPESERGTLVRLLGPPCASLLGLLLCAKLGEQRPVWEAHLDQVARRYEECLDESSVALGTDPSVCLGVGEDALFAPSLMWKWQEALYTRLPLGIDVLAFAHGPLQALYGETSCVLVLKRSGFAQGDIWERLEKTLIPERHRLISLTAHLPGPLAYFEYDAMVSRLLVQEVALRGIDPLKWPGQGADGALYSLAERT